MTYELAEQLKDAGFPQDKKEGKFIDDIGNYDEMGMYKIIYIPTLSELIEACGDGFVDLSLIENKNYTWESSGKYWCCDEHGEGYKFGQGKTPEEAVAKLWLELNESKRNTTTRKD